MKKITEFNIAQFDFGFRRDLVIERPELNPNRKVIDFLGSLDPVPHGYVFITEDYHRAEVAQDNMAVALWPTIRWFHYPGSGETKLLYYPYRSEAERVDEWTDLPGMYRDLYCFLVDEGFLRPGWKLPLNR